MHYRTLVFLCCGILIAVNGLEIVRIHANNAIQTDPRIEHLYKNYQDVLFKLTRRESTVSDLKGTINDVGRDLTKSRQEFKEIRKILRRIKRDYEQGHKGRLRLAKRQFDGFGGKSAKFWDKVIHNDKEISDNEKNDSAKEHERPPKEHEKPPKEHEKPPKEHEKPPKEHEKPPKEHEKPPKEHEKPPKKHENPRNDTRTKRSMISEIVELLPKLQVADFRPPITTPTAQTTPKPTSSTSMKPLNPKEQEKIESFLKSIEEEQKVNKLYGGYWLKQDSTTTPAPTTTTTASTAEVKREKKEMKHEREKRTKRENEAHKSDGPRRGKRSVNEDEDSYVIPDHDDSERDSYIIPDSEKRHDDEETFSRESTERGNERKKREESEADDAEKDGNGERGSQPHSSGSSQHHSSGTAIEHELSTNAEVSKSEDESDDKTIVIAKPPDLFSKNRGSVCQRLIREIMREQIDKPRTYPPLPPVVHAEVPEFNAPENSKSMSIQFT